MHYAGCDFARVANGGPQDAFCFSGIRRAGDVIERSGAKRVEVMIPFGETREDDDWYGPRCRDDATEIAIGQSFMAENHAELLFVHEDSRFIEFHAADGGQPAFIHRRGYFFMMLFFWRDYQYLIGASHFVFLSFRGYGENGRNRCGLLPCRFYETLPLRPDAAAPETLIFPNRWADRSIRGPHASNGNFAGLYKIEQQVRL